MLQCVERWGRPSLRAAFRFLKNVVEMHRPILTGGGGFGGGMEEMMVFI